VVFLRGVFHLDTSSSSASIDRTLDSTLGMCGPFQPRSTAVSILWEAVAQGAEGRSTRRSLDANSEVGLMGTGEEGRVVEVADFTVIGPYLGMWCRASKRVPKVMRSAAAKGEMMVQKRGK